MKFKHVAGILPAGAFVLLMMIAGSAHGAKPQQNNVPIRIGWQLPTATQGQIVEVLKRTNVLEGHGLEPTFVPFSYGEPETDAALADHLDVMFSSGQSAIDLIARGGKWKIAARAYYNRSAIMVPPDSPVKEVKDLRGKTVATPFESIAQREAILREKAAGLDADKEVKNVNMNIFDIQKLVEAGGSEKWEEIDAVGVWEPDISLFELQGSARILIPMPALGLVSISNEFIASHPEAAIQFLVALARAWDYFSRYPDRVNQWYIDDSQFGFTNESLSAAAKPDPNFGAKSLSEIDLQFKEDDFPILEQAAAWAQERGYSQTRVQVRQAVDQSLLARAMKEITSTRFENPQVIMPSARALGLAEKQGGFFFTMVPLWAFSLLVILLTLLAIEAGHWLGARRRRLAEHESESAVGIIVGAVLGLLAFVIALTFGAAGGRFDARKEALLGDVAAIQTAYARAGLVPEPHRTVTRALLRDYVEARIHMADEYENSAKLRALQARAASISKILWSHAEALAEHDKNEIYALFSESLTDIVNFQTRRIAFGVQFRIPTFVWVVVIIASCLAMFVLGFAFGLSGRRSFPAQLALALTFALMLQVIYDLDRPGKGFIRLNQQPMIDLYQNLSTQKQYRAGD